MRLVALLNLAYFGVEMAVALSIGSVSLLADSADFFEDAAVNFLMIDDDEIASPDWLERMLRAAEASGADIVGGPVFPDFDDERKRGLRRHARHQTGIAGHRRAVHRNHIGMPARARRHSRHLAGADLDVFAAKPARSGHRRPSGAGGMMG